RLRDHRRRVTEPLERTRDSQGVPPAAALLVEVAQSRQRTRIADLAERRDRVLTDIVLLAAEEVEQVRHGLARAQTAEHLDGILAKFAIGLAQRRKHRFDRGGDHRRVGVLADEIFDGLERFSPHSGVLVGKQVQDLRERLAIARFRERLDRLLTDLPIRVGEHASKRSTSFGIRSRKALEEPHAFSAKLRAFRFEIREAPLDRILPRSLETELEIRDALVDLRESRLRIELPAVVRFDVLAGGALGGPSLALTHNSITFACASFERREAGLESPLEVRELRFETTVDRAACDDLAAAAQLVPDRPKKPSKHDGESDDREHEDPWRHRSNPPARFVLSNRRFRGADPRTCMARRKSIAPLA